MIEVEPAALRSLHVFFAPAEVNRRVIPSIAVALPLVLCLEVPRCSPPELAW